MKKLKIVRPRFNYNEPSWKIISSNGNIVLKADSLGFDNNENVIIRRGGKISATLSKDFFNEEDLGKVKVSNKRNNFTGGIL